MLGRIQRGHHRYADWKKIFGSDLAPVLEPPKPNEFGLLRILIDVGRLDDGQLRRLACKVAQEKRIPTDRVLEEMRASGSVLISGEGVDMVEEVGSLW